MTVPNNATLHIKNAVPSTVVVLSVLMLSRRCGQSPKVHEPVGKQREVNAEVPDNLYTAFTKQCLHPLNGVCGFVPLIA